MKTLFPATIYEKFTAGKSLTDAEVAYAADYFTTVGDQLWVCGPVFHLAANEARRVGRRMYEFMYERKERK